MMRPTALRTATAAVALVAVWTVGCAAPRIHNPATIQPSPGRVDGSVLVGRLELYAQLEQALALQLQQAGVSPRIIPERNAGGGVNPPAYLVEFQIGSYSADEESFPPAAVVISALTFLIIPWAFIGLVREDTDHAMVFDVVVYDVSNLPLAAPGRSDDGPRGYDTSRATPLVRRTYGIDMKSSTSIVREPSGAQARKFRWAQWEQLATRMLNASLHDIVQAIRAHGGAGRASVRVR